MEKLNAHGHTEYHRLRKKGFNAKQSYSQAKTYQEWDRLDGFTFDGDERAKTAAPNKTIYCPGPIRLILEPEGEYYDDSFIDTWTDMRECEREKYRKELWDRIERDGVWILCGEYWNDNEWEMADCCGGFIGDDWENSGYDSDTMDATIQAYQNHLETKARFIEDTRPDMYERVSL